jgi:LacI family transcriptional regulator
MVLNNKLGRRNIRADLAEAIRRLARESGYRPNQSALAFLSGRHQTLAVFLGYLGGAGSSLIESLIRGISETAESCGQRLWLRMCGPGDGDRIDYKALFADVNTNMVDGLIFGGNPDPQNTRELVRLRSTGLPVVRIRDPGDEPTLVGIQDVQQEVCRIGTAHLIERGCRRIAHLAHSKQRTEGYLSALDEAGIEADLSLIRPAEHYTYAAGLKAATRLLADGVPFDGISAQSDHQAVGAMHVLLQAGIDVPRQVKIVGVDDSPFCQFTPVPLSSVDKNEMEKGRMAVRMLLDLIDGKPVRQATVAPVLRVRESTV